MLTLIRLSDFKNRRCIEANLDEDPWDEIEDTSNDNVYNSGSSSNIDDIDENFIEDFIAQHPPVKL